ncbi:MAG TPA: glycosyltransferase [Thermoanaerobaculia bacterium]
MTVHGTTAAPEITAVVPTVGRSPWLAACLRALRRQADAASLEILVVDQAPQPLALPPGLADRVLRPERNLGFAGGTNLGLAAARGELLATVNDDAVVGPGWLAALTAALRGDPRAAAAQGINTLAGPAGMEAGVGDGSGGGGGDGPRPGDRMGQDEPERIDGCGLGWNRWWQAIQIGHGEPLPPPGGNLAPVSPAASGLAPDPPADSSSAPLPPVSFDLAPSTRAAGGAVAAVEIFGVSATAALFRRSALERVALGGQVFDPRLVSYYEDSELAGRLRAAGFSALLVPAARARHLGSASGRTAAAARERWRLIYGNRYLAAARLLGRGLWPRLPLMLLRDLLDVVGPAALLHALLRRDRRLLPGDHETGPGARRGRLSGMAAGWARALRHLPAFAHTGLPAPSRAEVTRLSRWPARWQP